MHITYERPTTIGDQIDPAAPAAGLDPTGAECAATTYDVGGLEWHCTRRPGHVDDEHRAAFDVHGGGPTGGVGFAWQYEWGGAGHGPSSTDPMTTVTATVSFPSTAWTNGQLPDAIADEIRSVFWECDHDDVTVGHHRDQHPAPGYGLSRGRRRLSPRGEKRRDDTVQECAAHYCYRVTAIATRP